MTDYSMIETSSCGGPPTSIILVASMAQKAFDLRYYIASLNGTSILISHSTCRCRISLTSTRSEADVAR